MQIMGFPAGPYKTNCYLVCSDTHAAVIDPGMHAANYVREVLADKNLKLDKIVLTHGHVDHTRDAAELAAEFQAPVYIHPADAFMLVDGSGVSERSLLLFNCAEMVPITDPTALIDGQSISLAGSEFMVHHAPGHSPGSVLLVNAEVAFTGDVLFRGSVGRTDLPHSNPGDMLDTLAGPVWNLANELAILPGHGATSSMRRERATNPFLKSLAKKD
ncbi:MBL fold metallo-hydrolase [Corynebacterium caspium]|uniref:MBL fold metallo-hydrolase n=1 Tax=Corynebacterium caspium TaxID=234828 RepID=UPI00039BB2D6|nr:MBL fold metallo-hydrolase [Corynebacterium caspium]WKD59186.1 putative metallo-hydrolase [Corynebacterium caspium DSM 44850]